MSRGLGIEKIVVSFQQKRCALPTQELLRCRTGGIEIIEGNSFYEMLSGKLMVESINPAWLIFSNGFQKSRMRRFVKRTADLTLSSTMLIALSPFLLLVAAAIRLDSPGPVFFHQMRVGERRRIYRMYKFRSMVKDAENLSGPVWAQENDPRVTRVGRVLRRLRIDELPQLLNVVKGEMSFVGPRPEREVFVQELEKIVPYYGERFSVRPGITGWAQVNYGYGASVRDAAEKLNYDLFYIKNMSNLMDLLVVLRTIKILLFGYGAR
jgi:sugar transferase (PEP-CTERM system associated)